MPTQTKRWEKGRGRLGRPQPLLGAWKTEADSPQGRATCTRAFSSVLEGSYIQLAARWQLPDRIYEERALFGVALDARLAFWSFTSDGKNAQGTVADGTNVHPEAVAFEAHMDAGLARQIYWPAADEGFHWAVETRTEEGWKRFVEHHYRPA